MHIPGPILFKYIFVRTDFFRQGFDQLHFRKFSMDVFRSDEQKLRLCNGRTDANIQIRLFQYRDSQHYYPHL